MKILIILLILCSSAFSEEISLDDLSTEDVKSFSVEYISYCRDISTERYIKCPENKDGNGGFIIGKPKRVCRESLTGRFIKCLD